MLGQGLRRELPEAYSLARRVAWPRVYAMPWPLAALAGLGATWLAASVLEGAIFVLFALDLAAP
ncbi:MAG TPA: hypothetical protein VFM93_08955, partial [Candidatus Limnocylindria bacterium]|nr:hypothetical protein [Candidatus Limnocylindria bacterium]